jgi:hypothetical protein
MFGIGKKENKQEPVVPGPTSEPEKPVEAVKPQEEPKQPDITGPTSEPEKPKEENADMTLTSKKEPEKKKEALKIDGKEVRSVYEFKDYFVYDFVGGGRKKVMKKDVKKDEEGK